MATKICPACKSEVDADASVCAHCRHKFKGGKEARNRRALIILAVVLVLALVIGIGLKRASDKNSHDAKCSVDSYVGNYNPNC